MANQELENTLGPDPVPVNNLYFPENIGGPKVNAGLPNLDNQGSGSGLSELQQAIMKSMGAENTSQFAYENSTLNDKYSKVFKGLNNEELYAQNQSALDKAGNGLAKLAGTTATTLAGNTAGLLYGITKGISDGKFSSVYNNEFTQKMDDFSKYMENKYPHYYTAAELKDPLALRSIFTGNFFWDKIVKNLGFSAGAGISAYGFSAALEALSLSKSLVASGRALQALEATETGVNESKGVSSVIQALKNPKNTLSKFGGALEEFGTVEAGAKYSTANRLLSSYLGVSGEAGMESFQNAKQFRENAIKDYVARFGEQPSDEELQKIEEHAAQVGNWSYGLNAALLTGTEYIQLPKIFGSTYSGEKRILNDVVFKDGLWKSTLPSNRIGKALYKAKNVASLFFNEAEAFEEGAQFAIQQGTNNFFNKKYRSGEQTSFFNSFGGLFELGGEGILGQGTKEALTTTEGLENILLGGLSGALMTAGVFGVKTTEDGSLKPSIFGTGKIGERGFTGYGGEKGNYTEQALTTLNNNKFNDLVDSINRGMTISEDRERTLRQGDVLESKDLETDYMLNYMLPRMKYGGKTIVDEEINATREQASTDEGFLALKEQGIANENDTREAFMARLDNIHNMATQVNENYAKFKTSYAGVIKTDDEGKPVLDDKGNPQRKYDDKVIDKMVYTVSKIFDYNNRIPGLANTLATQGISSDELLAETTIMGKPSKEKTKEALDTINKLDVTDDVKTDLKTALQDALELTMRRNDYIREFNKIKEDPSKFDEGEDKEATTAKIKQTEILEGKKKTVTKEVEIGKEYTLADPVVRTGNALTLNPTISVLSKTLQGEYEVKLPDGSRQFLTPSEFKRYNLSEATQDKDTIASILDKAIDKVLGKAKYGELEKPTENKLDYVNSLDNSELVNDIQKEFAATSKEYIAKKAKEFEAIRKGNLSKELLVTADELSIPTTEDSSDYEIDARKTDQQVVDSSTPATEKFNQGIPLADHHVRANQFGANFYALPGNENFRGVVVTSKNEKQIGLPGLTQWLKEKGTDTEDIDPTQTIVMVIMGTDPITGGRFFVGVDGQKLDNPTLENTIYQAFPKSLTWSNGDSMFRDANANEEREQTITSYSKTYDEWRTATLKSPTSNLYKIQASFGNPEYSGELDSAGIFVRDYKARVSAEQAGLVFDKALRTKRVLGVPTSNDAQTSSNGSSTINNAKGLPILAVSNGLIKLDNRQFTAEEASTMFDVIQKLANNLFADGNLKSGESQMLYNWLKSVVYWGTPTDLQGNRKPAGYSSIFFENMTLKIGKEEKEFSIQPSDLAENKNEIIDMISKLYHNVNSSWVKGTQDRTWNAKYTEITAIKGDKIETREWQNYQSYLLSNTDPQGNFRDNIPLTTQIRAIKGADDTNRKGIYFTLVDKKGNTSDEVKEVKAKKKALPAPTKELAAPINTGEVTITIPNLGEASYTIDRDKYQTSLGKEGVTLSVPEATFETILNKLIATSKSPITEDSSDEEKAAAVNAVVSSFVVKDIEKDLAAPAPVVSDIEARRKEAINQATTQNSHWSTPLITTDKNSKTPIKVTWWSKEDMINDINSGKHDAELAALEGGTPTTIAPSLQEKINKRKKEGNSNRGSEYRLQIANNFKKFQTEDWKQVEKALAKMLPNVPLYRVKNMIQATNGRLAWGMLQEGGIYLYTNAEVGTVYHEVFEAVWKMFATPEERTAVMNEFRSREGSYTDKFTGRDIKYSEATDQDIKEQLAEEFREHMLNKTAKEGKSLISKLFSQLYDFIKAFFVGDKAQENTDTLFKNIGTGYYATYSPNLAGLSYAKNGIIDIDNARGGVDDEFSLTAFTGTQINDIMQHMTYVTVKDLFETDEGLFNIIPSQVTKNDLYEKLMDEMGDVIAENIVQLEQMTDEEATPEERAAGIEANNTLYKNILDNWDSLVAKHKEYLKSYSIQFDENDNAAFGEIDKGKDTPYGDPTKIDNMKKANSAIKLLLATLPVVDENGVPQLSSIGGYTLLPMSETYISVMNNTHSSRNITEMMSRIKDMSKQDPKYIKLYNRLSKLKSIDELNTEADLQMLASLWKTFKKQAPTVKNVYILENGDVQVGDANFSSAARQTQADFIEDIKGSINDGSKYFVYNASKNVYYGREGSIKIPELNSLKAQVEFLKELGIDFDYDKLSKMPEKALFSRAVNGVRQSIAQAKQIVTFSGKTLSIDKRLRQLAEIKTKMDNPEFSSTFYNVNGEMTQTFIGTNAASDLYDALSQINNVNELKNTQYAYLLTDSFAKNSTILWAMFDKESGDRIEGNEDAEFDNKDILHTAYAGGVIDEKTGKQKESSKLTYKDRLLQEVNLNTEGWYLNLIPGDASIEWMMFMGNRVSKDDINVNFDAIHNIFRGYFIDEFNLARERRTIAKGENRSNADLRFFKSILGEKIHDEFVAEEGEVFSPEEIYNDNKAVIDQAVTDFIVKERTKLKQSLIDYGLLKAFDNGYKTKGLTFGRELMTEDDLNRQLDMLSANYAINNIELHKVLYSDPYQYSEELKRIKSFSSPRQSIIADSVEMNTALDNVWNRKFKKGDLGHTDFNVDHFTTITIEDVIATNDLPKYGKWDETDGAGMIALPAHRNLKIRAGEWDNEQEKQYEFDIKYEKAVKKGISEKNLAKMMLDNPGIQRMYTPSKPIVSGNKANGKLYNDIVLDKFALFPLSFRVLHELNPNSNAIKLYNKMQEEGIDYAVYKSGRKVGAEKLTPLYNKDDSFNQKAFEGIVNVPFSIISIQQEVSSKEENFVTRGSQMTKLATLDYMAAGMPIDFMTDEKDFGARYEAWYKLDEAGKQAYNNGDNLYNEIKNNQAILGKMIEKGFQNLLKTLDIEQVEGGYKIGDIKKVADTLKKELTKTGINDNILEALAGFKKGEVVIEATPAYQQIRNILYSIADREVISPKISGGLKVQIPSTLLESNRIKAENGAYTSTDLKFYEDADGQRVCEIMVARWFESDLSDEELIEKLNGSGVLDGVAFRIPTQKQNSIDVFRIAKFLPKDFKDSVVIPSALVRKVGSDFDIDKLSIYLKNVDDSERGVPRMLSVDGNKMENLENAYIQSLEKLISHPLNFERLTSPNSAKQLEDLSTDIVKKLGLEGFDYQSTGNMLDRRFMSRLRHAFVTGKYAIGIAAVNQTNHSLNQRADILIDFEGRKDLLNATDRHYLKDGKIKFEKFNTMNGLPSLSMIKNANNEYISDILSQFIDGYVDISKGPWIMELGATPNVASTWMFLVKVGVPINTIAYFMNQPIIRDYLRDLERKGYTWLFNDGAIKRINKKYEAKKFFTTKMPSEEKLYENIGKKEFTPAEKSEQKFILEEFLKYAKMAEQMFTVTQGTNFDTASFNDPFLITKKLAQLEKARNTIVSSVDKILESSFIGVLGDNITKVRNAIAELLKADKGNVRELLNKVLAPYTDMNDRDFVRTSQRAVATLFDWAVQTNDHLNEKIKTDLLSKENTAQEMWDFIKPIVASGSTHPLKDNQVVKILKPHFGAPGEVNNLQIRNKNNKIYDQNQMIYAFQELKNYLQGHGRAELYDKLVTLAVLQSGLTESNISFTNLLPYEDIKRMYNDTLFDIQSMSTLPAFADLNVFERTFWNYSDMVTHMAAEARMDYYTGETFYNENMSFTPDIYNAIQAEDLPPLLRLSSYDRESQDDIIVYTWDKQNITKKQKIEMRKNGDFSYRQKGLFKKVGSYNAGYGKINYIYKAINAWGDGKWANEFYAVPQKSVIDNGFIQVDELKATDAKIMSYFGVTDVATPTEQVANVVERLLVEDIGRQFDIEPGLGLTKENFENPKGYDEFLAERARIENKIAKLEERVQNGVAGPDDYSDIETYENQLRKLLNSNYVGSISEDKNFYIGELSAVYNKVDSTYDLESSDGVIYEGLSEEQVMKFGEAMQTLDKYDEQIGDIITIENGKFRLLDVQEVDNPREKLLKLFSQSGITTNAVASVSDEGGTWGELTVKILSLEEMIDQYNDIDWKEEDNNDTCNPF